MMEYENMNCAYVMELRNMELCNMKYEIMGYENYGYGNIIL